MIPSIGKDGSNTNSYTGNGSVNYYNHYKTILELCNQVEEMHSLQPSNSILTEMQAAPGYISKDVPSSTVHNFKN